MPTGVNRVEYTVVQMLNLPAGRQVCGKKSNWSTATIGAAGYKNLFTLSLIKSNNLTL
jgi:hypothetical protein